MVALFPIVALWIAAVGVFVATANPEKLLTYDRRTGRALFERELARGVSREAALGVAARFYRRFGLAVAGFAVVMGIVGAAIAAVA
jgi:anti-sigma-K factor RskA